MKLGIIGLGLIGGSIALDLKRSGFALEVFGFDSQKDHINDALRLGLIDEALSLRSICQRVDLLVLAVPVDVIVKLLPQVMTDIEENCTVTDVGSTKFKIIDCIKDHKNRKNYVAAHPMAGTEFSGPTAAHRGLFYSKALVICNEEDSGKVHLEKVQNMFTHLGMRILKMDAKDHDLHAAYVSHLSHISSFILANTVLDKEKDHNTIFNLASAGFESTVRLAKSSPEMWNPIFEQNQKFILQALAAYIDHLNQFYEHLKNSNTIETKNIMKKSNEIKRVLVQLQTNSLGMNSNAK